MDLKAIPSPRLRFRVWGLGFKVPTEARARKRKGNLLQGSGFRVYGRGFGGFGFRAQGLGNLNPKLKTRNPKH